MRYKQAGNYPTAESTRSILFNLNCMRVSHIFFFLFYPCKNKMKKNCGNLTMATRKVVSVPLFCGSYKNNQWKGYNGVHSQCAWQLLLYWSLSFARSWFHSHNASSCYKIGVVLNCPVSNASLKLSGKARISFFFSFLLQEILKVIQRGFQIADEDKNSLINVCL